MSTVSVIVPTYNCAHFLPEAIDSILQQTHQPDQIIVVDDGSTDDTEQVVRKFTEPRIEYIRQQNAGVSAARNTGLNAARGEFVTFLDADDRWRLTFVERMRALLSSDPAAVCVFANFLRFEHPSGAVLKDQFTYYPELRHSESGFFRRLPEDVAFSTLVTCGEFPAFTQVMMFRRALIGQLRFDPGLKLCEDAHFALQAFMRGAVMYTDEVLADVRRHGGNASSNVSEMVIHKLKALKALAPAIVADHHLSAYRDRLVKAHIDAALFQARSGRFRTALETFWDGFLVPGSMMRKVKGAARMALMQIS